MKKRFICKDCGEVFEIEVIDRKEAEERHIESSPIQCKKCGSYKVEESKKYY